MGEKKIIIEENKTKEYFARCHFDCYMGANVINTYPNAKHTLGFTIQ